MQLLCSCGKFVGLLVLLKVRLARVTNLRAILGRAPIVIPIKLSSPLGPGTWQSLLRAGQGGCLSRV